MTGNQRKKTQSLLSERMLKDALLLLMSEVPYECITVTSLTDSARLSRRTFYRHYNSVDEVLDDMIQDKSDAFAAYRKNMAISDIKGLVRQFFSFWNKYRLFLDILRKNRLLHRLEDSFFVCDTSPDILVGYAVRFASGAIWSLLFIWLERGFAETPEEMATITEQIIGHLASAL